MPAQASSISSCRHLQVVKLRAVKLQGVVLQGLVAPGPDVGNDAVHHVLHVLLGADVAVQDLFRASACRSSYSLIILLPPVLQLRPQLFQHGVHLAVLELVAGPVGNEPGARWA